MKKLLIISLSAGLIIFICSIFTIQVCNAEPTRCLKAQIIDHFHAPDTDGEKCMCPVEGKPAVYEGKEVNCDVVGFDCQGKKCGDPDPIEN